MIPLPPWLPPANSRKWRSRKSWDSLGYLRVRSLSNPNWQGDLHWLTRVVRLERDFPGSEPDEAPFFDDIVACLRRYPQTRAGVYNSEGAWDEVLSAFDALSLYRQEKHLEAIQLAWESDSEV